MIHIAIVDDHELVAEGFARLINLQDDMEVVSMFNSYQDTIDQLQLSLPDLMIIDISLPDKSGIELISYIRKKYPEIKLITLSMYDIEPYISNALNAGASGYLSKRVAPEELIHAIQKVFTGQNYLSEDITLNRFAFRGKSDQLDLTQREKEVLILLAQSKAIKTIAAILDMQPKTVHAHKANITKKLNLTSIEEMRKIALKHHLISVDDLI